MFKSGKNKSKDSGGNKSQFYVEFLGWMECRGLRGYGYTEPIIRELRRRHRKMDSAPKLTIQVSKKDIKITQELEERRNKGIKKITFPTIPSRDVTFVHQASQPDTGAPDDIVACIFLGYMPRTQRYVHVHVYRFDEARTATLFVSQMSQIVESNMDHIQEAELKLASKGEIDDPKYVPPANTIQFHANDSAVGSTASTYSNDESPTFGSDEIEEDLQSLADVQPFDSVASELKHRLHMGDAPLLLPPKDYDTISRAHGNLEHINARRCMNLNIIGSSAFKGDADDINEPSSSEIDAAKEYERGKVENLPVTKLKSPDNRPSPNSSPKLQHMFLAPNDTQKSPRVAHRPTNLLESNQSPNMPFKLRYPEMSSPVNDLYPSKKSPLLASPVSDSVYPPKGMNSPKSPRIFHAAPKSDLSRQNSANSLSSEGSKQSHRSDDGRLTPQIPRYVYGSNDDVYSMPFKVTKQAPPMDECPPDYQDDDAAYHPVSTQPYGESYLTRSLPEELIRNKMHTGNGSRPNSGELRHGGRLASPIVMTSPQTQMRSPGIHRKGPNNR
ncbi:unnamed protein product [Candidula unifasciata]|uniref:Uncharacterized protein n=1 Tax=Candidula unifasciata TaxID=100452 RepID=A0A8S3YMX3_9EUPU|nr:unnamed protein product [Candidula unifasciata]